MVFVPFLVLFQLKLVWFHQFWFQLLAQILQFSALAPILSQKSQILPVFGLICVFPPSFSPSLRVFYPFSPKMLGTPKWSPPPGLGSERLHHLYQSSCWGLLQPLSKTESMGNSIEALASLNPAVSFYVLLPTHLSSALGKISFQMKTTDHQQPSRIHSHHCSFPTSAVGVGSQIRF